MQTKDECIRQRLREISEAFPRWGWRKAHWVLANEGLVINKKRTRRIWREEGLKVPYKKKHRCRRGQRIDVKATAINQVWAGDFQTDQTQAGRRLKWFNIVDEYTKESLAQVVAHNITAADVVEILKQLVSERGGPKFIRFDNGPEFTANAIANWCRNMTTTTTFIDPGSPWQNAYVESFNGRFRDEVLDIELFGSRLEAQVLTDDWRWIYNNVRPHGSLGGQTPAEFAQTCKTTENQPVTL
jgi:transposase InsO family protein